MRKKGFTLAELLGVLVIIALLLILIIPGVINRLSNSGDEAKDAENEIIYNAADQYIKEHPKDYPPGKSGRYCITIQSLIDAGLLAEPVTDVNTGEDLSDKSVMVTIYSTGNTDHEIKEGAECDEIAALPMIDFIVEPNGSSWVKQRKVTIVYPKVDGDYEASHRIDGGSWTRDSSADDGGNIEIVFTKISKLEARLKGDNVISSKIDIINVDSEIPVITKVSMGSWGNQLNAVNITAKDEVSGIVGLFISTSNSRPSENDSGWISVSSNPGETKTFVRNLDLGTYYIWVKDKAGNISANGTSLKVTDTTKPTCSISDTGTKGSNQWYTSNVNLKISTSDKESGVASYGMNTSNSATYNGSASTTHTGDTGGVTYYGYVKDAAGNTCKSSKWFKKDSTAPSVPYCINFSTSYLTQISTTCNGSRDCYTVFNHGSGYWSWSANVVKGDNLSGLNDVQEYLKSTNPYSSSCNWISKSSCNVTASRQIYPSVADNKYRSIDNAGNVSAVAECDVEVR